MFIRFDSVEKQMDCIAEPLGVGVGALLEAGYNMLDWFLPLNLFETVILVSFCWRGFARFHLLVHLRELHFFSHWEVLVPSFFLEFSKFIFFLIILFLVLILNVFLRFGLLLLPTGAFLDLEILSEMNSILLGQFAQFLLHPL